MGRTFCGADFVLDRGKSSPVCNFCGTEFTLGLSYGDERPSFVLTGGDSSCDGISLLAARDILALILVVSVL